MTSQSHKEPLGKVQSKVGTVLNSNTKRRKKMSGKRGPDGNVMVEDEKLEEILDRRGAEGVPMQADVLQKVHELVVHERMSQSKT